MNAYEASQRLDAINACTPFVKWVSHQSTWEEAWKVCHRADWMMWLLGVFSGSPDSVERKGFVRCLCDLHHCFFKDREKRLNPWALESLKKAEKYANGELSFDAVGFLTDEVAEEGEYRKGYQKGYCVIGSMEFGLVGFVDAAINSPCCSGAAENFVDWLCHLNNQWINLADVSQRVREFYPEPPDIRLSIPPPRAVSEWLNPRKMPLWEPRDEEEHQREQQEAENAFQQPRKPRKKKQLVVVLPTFGKAKISEKPIELQLEVKVERVSSRGKPIVPKLIEGAAVIKQTIAAKQVKPGVKSKKKSVVFSWPLTPKGAKNG